MIAKVFSAALTGLNSQIIEIETSVDNGLRCFNIVGLADTAIKEAKERVGSAIKASHLRAPQESNYRVLINLAPANIKKEGTSYDLALALSYLIASKQTSPLTKKILLAAELALDGSLKPINGALSLALTAKSNGFAEIILPKENAREAALCNVLGSNKELKIIPADNLLQALAHLEERATIQPTAIAPEELQNPLANFEIEFSWIKGQSHAKRGLEIAASGGHNLMLQGPPGSGKTLLAKSVCSILPTLTSGELLELTQIYSASGLLSNNNILRQRPFRAPHHSASIAALIGGGNPVRPGEITLSHRGVLFMDEFPEFHRDVLEALRQPLEEGAINIQRARSNLSFPAKFFLIASANPCPCGYYNDPEKACACTASQVASYRRKLSGPLIDRFDIFCWVPQVKYEELVAPTESLTNSAVIRDKIEKARKIQAARFKGENILTNAEMKLPDIKKYCQVDSRTNTILKRAVDMAKLSARGYHRVLKVSRTIADLSDNENITFDNVSEALAYRQEK